jgi:proline dehydrogenase
MNHQDRIDSMRRNMKRHLVGKSYAEIHTELAMRADSHREQVISLSSAQLANAQYTGTIQSACFDRIERKLMRVGDKIKQLNTTVAWGIVSLAAVLVIKTLIYHFK